MVRRTTLCGAMATWATMNSLASCGSAAHFQRRSFIQAAVGLSGIAWLTPLAERLARAAADEPGGKPAKSVIILWMSGGPSQLETFDPHAGTRISHESTK